MNFPERMKLAPRKKSKALHVILRRSYIHLLVSFFIAFSRSAALFQSCSNAFVQLKF
jgi:hypothetical protein